jgi:hypothetical protein
MEAKPDAVVEAARQLAGLRDFETESFREGLDLYLADVAAESRLTDEGRERILGQAAMMLANRLQVDDWLRRHPEALEVPIGRPLFVLGMPRTGTTLAIDLIHTDPRRRCLLKWEATRCVPPPELETFDSDPRLLELRAQLEPALAAMKEQGVAITHWEEADDPTECIFVLAQDFRCLMWGSLLPTPRYNEWVLEADPEPAYRHLERVLQLLQWKVRGAWSLKMPSHSLNLPTLKKVFPDARMVVTHRDPYRTLGSLCSMIANAHALYIGESDDRYIAEHYPGQLALHANRPMAYREAHGDADFLDVLYADLVRDPVGEMRRVYAFTGDAWSDDVEARMRAWLERNPQDKHGRHRYDLSQFGLDRSALEPLFEPYRTRYGIPLEDA